MPFSKLRLVIVITAVIASLALAPVFAQQHLIYLTITDICTHAPLANVSVILFGYGNSVVIETNNEGFANFTGISEGEYQLQMNAVGYYELTEPLNVVNDISYSYTLVPLSNGCPITTTTTTSATASTTTSFPSIPSIIISPVIATVTPATTIEYNVTGAGWTPNTSVVLQYTRSNGGTWLFQGAHSNVIVAAANGTFAFSFLAGIDPYCTATCQITLQATTPTSAASTSFLIISDPTNTVPNPIPEFQSTLFVLVIGIFLAVRMRKRGGSLLD